MTYSIPSCLEVQDGHYDDYDDMMLLDDFAPWSDVDEAASWLEEDARAQRRADV